MYRWPSMTHDSRCTPSSCIDAMQHENGNWQVSDGTSWLDKIIFLKFILVVGRKMSRTFPYRVLSSCHSSLGALFWCNIKSIMLRTMHDHEISPRIYSGPVAQWIRHLTTNQGIPGSSPGRVVLFIGNRNDVIVYLFKLLQWIQQLQQGRIMFRMTFCSHVKCSSKKYIYIDTARWGTDRIWTGDLLFTRQAL